MKGGLHAEMETTSVARGAYVRACVSCVSYAPKPIALCSELAGASRLPPSPSPAASIGARNFAHGPADQAPRRRHSRGRGSSNRAASKYPRRMGAVAAVEPVSPLSFARLYHPSPALQSRRPFVPSSLPPPSLLNRRPRSSYPLLAAGGLSCTSEQQRSGQGKPKL